MKFTLLFPHEISTILNGIMRYDSFLRMSTKRRKSEEYKVLDFQFNSAVNTCKSGSEPIHSNILPSASIGNDSHSTRQQVAPTYSVFVGEGAFNDDPTNLH